MWFEKVPDLSHLWANLTNIGPESDMVRDELNIGDRIQWTSKFPQIDQFIGFICNYRWTELTRVDNLTIASLCCDRCVAVILNVLKYVTLVNYYHAGRNADLSLSIHQVQLQSYTCWENSANPINMCNF